MQEALKRYKMAKDSTLSKVVKLLIILTLSVGYFYMILLWKPETYIDLLGVSKFISYLKIAMMVGLAIVVGLMIEIYFIRAPKYSQKYLKDYELWNKFFLHFAFMKTGSGSEKAQALDVLRYLEDGELKQTLTEVYEQTTSLKEAHQQIILKYPYPQVKTFFSESEDALVKGADGNRLMQKTALNIDKYINDILFFEKSKVVNYRMSLIMLCATFVLMLLAKLLFADVFIGFTDSITGLTLLAIFYISQTYLVIRTKRGVNKPLNKFGGDIDAK